ncbi:MAG: hypothetical protein MJ153_01730 [Clostridia bacterium]|nr:hypothetical protein [Clostridia bacterium]
MELMNPWAIYIGLAVAAVVILIGFKANGNYKSGKKVANDNLIKESSYYKRLVTEYKVCKTVVIATTVIAILCTSFLIARPVKIQTLTTEVHNRDIMLCFDTSDSTDECNSAVCDRMIKLVDEFQGERIGITIFNCKPVLLVPLTTDYAYVKDVLKKLKDSCEEHMRYNNDPFYFDPDYEKWGYKYAGTTNDDRGSSFIGEGLVAAVLNFQDLKEEPDRARIIVFLTDNDLNLISGNVYATIDDAFNICNKYKIKVFSLAPTNIVDADHFQELTESTGGKYYLYKSDKAVDNLRDDVKDTDTSVYVTRETKSTDVPKPFIIALIIALLLNFAAARRLHI